MTPTVPLVFVDCETTSLERPSSPTPGEVWEVAAVRRDPDGVEASGAWHLPVTLAHADPISLDIGRFHERHNPPDRQASAITQFVAEFGHLASGCHWVGNVPSFDEERIAALFHACGHTGRFPWHYHLIDIEPMIAGYLRGLRRALGPHGGGFMAPDYRAGLDQRADLASPPWDSEDLSNAIAIDPGDFERHTAMGDVRWCMAQWDAMNDTEPAGAPA